MNNIFENIQGDKTLWAVLILLAGFSFLPVYSAASNLAYVSASGNTFNFLFKHFIHLSLGFTFMYFMQKIPYHYFRGISILMIPVVIVLLLYTLFQPSITDSLTNTNRWIKIPFVGFTFQPSTLAGVILMIYVSRYLAKIKDIEIRFSKTILPLWIPTLLILLLILPANFSTTAIIFCMVVLLCFVGGYPIKYLLGIIFSGILVLSIFILTIKAYPGIFPNRVDTWKSRIENFVNKENTTENYQIEKAKIAIATGGVRGLGPGKSVQKNFLPQSSSDFIYAIIIEEYGFVMGVSILILYLILLYRGLKIFIKSDRPFGGLLSAGLSFALVIQAITNMCVVVGLLPVTGVTLPLVSMGGTSQLFTGITLGIILSISRENKSGLEYA